jgi:hypothetical protein
MSDMEARSVIPQPLLEALEYWEASGMSVSWGDFIATYSPITTRHVGTIAFQGTDAQINEAMQRYFGGVK